MRHRWTGASLLAGLLILASAAAADPVTVRTDVQPGFGRLTFIWPSAITHTAKLEAGVLTLAFGRPVEADWTGLSQSFGGYVSGTLISTDGRTVQLQLTKHFLFRSFEAGNQITVDFLGVGAPVAGQARLPPASAPVQTPAPAPAVQAAAPAPQPQPVAAAAVRVRIGQHEGYGRMVFDWKQDVAYTAVRDGNRMVIDFGEGTPIDLSVFNRNSLVQVAGVTAEAGGGHTVVSVAVEPGTRLRHFRNGTSVVVDILDPQPNEGARAPAAPEPPEPTPENAVAPQTPASAAAIAAAQPAIAGGAVVEGGLAGVSLGLQVTYTIPDEGAPQISLVTSRPVAMAAFMRAGYLWVVLDGVAEGDGMADIPEALAETVFLADRVGHTTATALRFRLADGVFPAIGLNADGWIINLEQEPTALNQPVELVRQNTADLGPVLILSITQWGNMMEITDPEVGDNLQVILVGVPGHGVAREHSFLQFRLLETHQGVVLQKQDDRVQLVEFPNGVAIAGTEALYLTPVPDGTVLGADNAAATEARLLPPETILKFAEWGEGPGERLVDTVRAYMYDLSQLPAENRNPLRVKLAQFLLTHGFETEALGIMEVVAKDVPERATQPLLMGMMGVGYLGADLILKADEILMDPILDGDPEMALWRGVLLAREDAWDAAHEQFTIAVNVANGYPPEFRTRANLWKGRVAFETNDFIMLDEVLAQLDFDAPEGEAGARADILKAEAFAIVEAVDEALALYDHVASLKIQPTTAEAKYKAVHLLMDAGELTPAQAVQDLEQLRYSWRGGEFEFNLLKDLGELAIAAGNYSLALGELRQVVAVFPDRAKEAGIAQKMNQLFEDLFLGGMAEGLAPVSALALYYEFRELTPVGDDGDEMVRLLADRLVEVDLLGQAADLLKYQVAFRLEGEQRALVAARLAVIYLLNRQYQEALDSIRGSRYRLADPALLQERAQLEAEALSGLELHEEGLALIANDISPEAKLLRGDIYWRSERWAENAAAIDDYLGDRWDTTDPFDDQTRALVMRAAVSLALAKDEAGTQWLRDRYLAKMGETVDAAAFDVVTYQVDLTTVAFRLVATSVAQLATLDSFMTTYLSRIQDGGVEAIN